MMTLFTFNSCPLCDSPRIDLFCACRDNLTRRGEFTIFSCEDCGFRFTNPYPSADDIHVFYESDDYTPTTNTTRGLLNKGYHLARRVMLRAKLRLVRRLSGLATGKLLDIGCGTGEFLATMKQGGWEVQGVEPFDSARDSAVARFNIPVTDLAGQSLLSNNAYDVITLWHVLEHAHDIHQSMSEISRLLKPGGLVLIGIPNCASWDAEFYGSHWAAYDTPRHLHHFTPDTLRRLAERHGFRVTAIHPLLFDPIYIPLLTEKERPGKNIFRGVYAATRSLAVSIFNPARCPAIACALKK